MPQLQAQTYNRLLLSVAGLGGLLYGVDVGIIQGAIPYLSDTFDRANHGPGLSNSQLSLIVAAVLLGSIVGTLFSGLLADWLGRKPLMIVSGLCFSASIPVIALAHTFNVLFLGRLLQGASGGLVGVVIPLYLAECLVATKRGKGAGIFQEMLVFGLVVAGSIALYFGYRVAAVERLHPEQLFAFKDRAWRGIFWASLLPGLLFVLGSLFISESPRWLFKKGRKQDARNALLRSNGEAEADLEMREMEALAEARTKASTASLVADSLLRRKYVIPFILACVILACNQTTGINSIIPYNTVILKQSGLSDVAAHWGSLLFNIVNFLVTLVAIVLVDRRGRKFLLTLGTGGIIFALVGTAILFRRIERQRIDVRGAVQAMVTSDDRLSLTFDQGLADRLAASVPGNHSAFAGRDSLTIIYSYGDFHASTPPALSGEGVPATITISRAALPATKLEALAGNPFLKIDADRSAPLKIDHALVLPVAASSYGWVVAAALYLFMASFAIGPGVVVWLALSELMPTRIRSVGMSVALMINQAVSTTIAAVFLPSVGKYGYSVVFYFFGACTVVYFVTAAFFLPETKGKSLEEIERLFEAHPPGVPDPSAPA